MDWMSEKQKADFEKVCTLIDSVKTPQQFYAVCNEINSTMYDFDVVNVAREHKKFFNSAQFSND